VGGTRCAAARLGQRRRGRAATTRARSSSRLGPCDLGIPTTRSSYATRWMGLRRAAAAGGSRNGSEGSYGPLVVPLGSDAGHRYHENEDDELATDIVEEDPRLGFHLHVFIFFPCYVYTFFFSGIM
jgi:hypothetical protein